MFGHDKDKNPDKEKKLSPKDMMAQQMEELEIYVKPFITVLHSPEYPGKGKKFIVFQDGVGPDGKPAGKRGKFWETDKPKEIASWIMEREGSIYRG
jgi:hypothetical protein